MVIDGLGRQDQVLRDVGVARTRADEPAPPKVVLQENVAYGHVHGAGLLADIAWPELVDKLPAIVSVHGGRWVGGHKRDASTIKVEQWAGFGFFAMSCSDCAGPLPASEKRSSCSRGGRSPGFCAMEVWRSEY